MGSAGTVEPWFGRHVVGAVGFGGRMTGRARVHELAKELGVTSKEVLAKLKDMGEFVKSASSTLDPLVVSRVRGGFHDIPAGTTTLPEHTSTPDDATPRPRSHGPVRSTEHRPGPAESSSDQVDAVIGWTAADRQAFEKEFHSRGRLFHSALVRINQALDAIINENISPSNRMRFRVEQGRIKTANRLLAKAQSSRYATQISRVEDVFLVIRDIVGTRITCNTVDDVRAIRRLIEENCTELRSDRSLTFLEAKDYLANPKPSGYRAVHLIVQVNTPKGVTQVPVTCEIQIRTLLQDAWGELTHEDTFKPGVRVPRLVDVLSKRLATALMAMDEIAQDLRDELESIAGDVVPGPSSGSAFDSTPGSGDIGASISRESQPSPRGGAETELDNTTSNMAILDRALDAGSRFERAYHVGARFLGTVVYLRDDYALVQSPQGDTGILHVSSFPDWPSKFINVTEFMQQGDTIEVEVVESVPDAGTIRLSLVGGDKTP